MSTETDDELRQLRAAVRGILRVDDSIPEPDLDWSKSWPALAELGLAGFCVAEHRGGFGLRADAAIAVAVELGAALHSAPFAGITAAAHALASADDPVASELVDDLVRGTRTCGFGRLANDGTTAYIVDGADATDALLLVDQRNGEFLLHESGSWSTDASAHHFDGSRTCVDVTVDLANVQRLPPVPAATDLHGLLLVADAVGCVQRMLDRTTAYAAERIAFGRPIGGYQAVQHRLVDHTVRARGMSLLVAEAGRLMVTGSPDAARHVAMAQVSVSSGALHILHDLVQLTGGIGFTWEYGLHHYERRVHQDARLAANPRAATRTLAELEGWTVAR